MLSLNLLPTSSCLLAGPNFRKAVVYYFGELALGGGSFLQLCMKYYQQSARGACGALLVNFGSGRHLALNT